MSRDLGPDDAGVVKYLGFKANGIYDPDYQTGGHQPMWVDEMAGFGFDYWFVLRSRIKVTPTPEDATAKIPITYGIILAAGEMPQPITQSGASLRDAMMEFTERNRGATKAHQYFLAVDQEHDSHATGLTMKYDAKTFYHVSKYSEIYNSAGFYGLAGQAGPSQDPTPTNTPIFWIWATMTNANQTTPSAEYPIRIEIDYDVLWLRDTTNEIRIS